MTVIFFRTIIIYILLSVVLRLLGKRQVGELEVSELVSTLILSELAALPIDDPDIPLLYALIPISLILSLEIAVTFLKNKFQFFKRIFETRPSFLIERGCIRQDELQKLRISVDELLGELRLQGYGDPADIYYAILEQNGQLSVIPRKEKTAPLCEDLSLKLKEDGMAHPLIIDGVIYKDSLCRVNKSKTWLINACKKKGYEIKDVFLCTMNDAGEMHIYKRKDL